MLGQWQPPNKWAGPNVISLKYIPPQEWMKKYNSEMSKSWNNTDDPPLRTKLPKIISTCPVNQSKGDQMRKATNLATVAVSLNIYIFKQKGAENIVLGLLCAKEIVPIKSVDSKICGYCTGVWEVFPNQKWLK